MSAKQIFKKMIYGKSKLTVKDYVTSQKYLFANTILASIIFNLMTGTYIAGVALYFGVKDSLVGIIGVMPAITSIIQVCSPLVFEKFKRRKALCMITFIIYRLLLVSIVFIPLITPNPILRQYLLLGIYCLSFILMNFASPAIATWQMSIVPNNLRADFFSRRDFYALIFNTIIGLTMGRVIDVFRNNGHQYRGFIVVYALAFLLVILEGIYIGKVKEPRVPTIPETLRLKDIFSKPLQNKNFRKVLIFSILWSFGVNIAIPFFQLYMIKYLKLSYTYIMVLGLISSICMVISIRFWGKFAQKHNWISTARVSMVVLILCYILWGFVSDKTIYLLIPVHVLNGIAWAGINIAMLNIPFIFAPKEGRIMYIGLNSAMSGIMSFLAVILGGVLLEILEKHEFVLWGIIFSKMQIVFIISGVLILLGVIYAGKISKVLKQEAN